MKIQQEVYLRARGLEVCYGSIRAVQDAAIEVQRGVITAIVGSNGAGKSSLLKTLAGLIRQTAGEIRVCDRDEIGDKPSWERVRKYGIVLIPEGRGVLPRMTVRENLEFGAAVGRKRANPQDVRARREGLDDLFPQLNARTTTEARFLSGGEQQMLAIARSLLMMPDALLVDEPSTGLSPVAVRGILDALRTIVDETKLAVLLVEQDTRLALNLAAYTYVMQRGQMILEGPSEIVGKDAGLKGAYLGS